MKQTLQEYSTKEILDELLKREQTDNAIELKSCSSTSYTFKFYRYD